MTTYRAGPITRADIHAKQWAIVQCQIERNRKKAERAVRYRAEAKTTTTTTKETA